MSRIFWKFAGFLAFCIVIAAGFLFNKHSTEILRNYDFLQSPSEYSAQHILNTAAYTPEDSSLTQGQILFFLNVAEEMDEVCGETIIGNLQMRSESAFEDGEFLKSIRLDARDRAFSVLRARLNIAYMSLAEYHHIRNRVLAGLEIAEPKSFKKVSSFKNISSDVLRLEESQHSLKKIISEAESIQLQQEEKMLVNDFKSRIVPHLLPVLAGLDAMEGVHENQTEENDYSLKN